jgi:hypothetical protein
MKIKMADGIPQKIENRIPSDWKEYDETKMTESCFTKG